MTTSADEWAIVVTLENGMTATWSKRGVIDSSSYERAQEFVEASGPERAVMGYTPDGGMYGGVALLGDKAIKVIRTQAVPRVEHVPQVHDTFRLHLNQDRLEQTAKAVTAKLRRGALLASPDQLSSSLQVFHAYQSFISHSGGESFAHLRQPVLKSHPMVWTEQMSLIATKAAWEETPRIAAAPSLVPVSPMFWLFTTPSYDLKSAGELVNDGCSVITHDGRTPWGDEEVVDVDRPVVGECIEAIAEGVRWTRIYADVSQPRGEIRLGCIYGNDAFELIPWGESDNQDKTTCEFEQFQLRRLTFLNSPYIGREAILAPRSLRRRLARSGAYPPKDVELVLLRRPIKRRVNTSGEHIQREYHCQWWVSGHWRNQWRASRGAHELRWIAPYIKGPEDKPFKQTIRAVVR
jgi:hypothetical protein